MIEIEQSVEENEPSYEQNFGWTDFVSDIWHKTIGTPAQMSQLPDQDDHESSTLLNDLKCYKSDEDGHLRHSVMADVLTSTPEVEVPEGILK